MMKHQLNIISVISSAKFLSGLGEARKMCVDFWFDWNEETC